MATEVGFYHLQTWPLERALPALLEQVLKRDLRAIVRLGSKERLEALNKHLWTYDPGSFLPHGGPDDGSADVQPVYLTSDNDNPNQATVLVLVDSAEAPDLDRFDRCVDMFDGTDEAAVAAARARWAALKESGIALTYWQQTPAGKWEKKAGSGD